MSKTILAQVDGFTPMIDAVVLDVGIISAAVLGKAWRYCQMSDGVCKASQERIADELGITRITVNTHFAKLVEAGYLKDTTPDLLGLPHIYIDTGKAGVSMIFTGGVNNLNTGSKESLQGGVNNINTKIVVKKEKKVKKQKKATTPQPPEILLFKEVVKHYPKQNQRESVISAIQKINTRLMRPATSADLLPFWNEWGTVSGNEWSLVWLVEWAVNGRKQKQAQSTEPRGFDAVRKWVSMQGEAVNNG